MNEIEIESIRKVIQSAINCELTIENLYHQWENSWNENRFLKEVFDNIEDSIEHMPGYFFSKEVNINKWHQTIGFKILNVDLELLNYLNDLSDLQLLKRREDLLSY